MVEKNNVLSGRHSSQHGFFCFCFYFPQYEIFDVQSGLGGAQWLFIFRIPFLSFPVWIIRILDGVINKWSLFHIQYIDKTFSLYLDLEKAGAPVPQRCVIDPT